MLGIDATPLPPRPVGAGNYIIQLIRALTALEEAPEMTIFAQQAGYTMLGLQESSRLHFVTLPDKRPLTRLVWEQTMLPSLARRAGVDLLHSLHYTMPLAYGGRSVVTFHDMTYFLYPQLHTLPKRYFFRTFIKLSARRAMALIADSESTRQDAIKLAGVHPAKIFTAPLGVTSGFTPISDVMLRQAIRLSYKLPERFILFVGLLEPRKNLPSLLRAFAQISAKVPEYCLVIAGRLGWMHQEINRLVLSLGLTDKVLFTGYIAQEDLPVVYNLADLSVYPSLYEGFGLPVLEAMACGTPVITTNVSSMPEIVGEAGYLVPPRDDQRLAEALLDLLSDAQERKRRSQAGLERAREFTWQRTARETLAVYKYITGS